jgi:hypothetical protein
MDRSAQYSAYVLYQQKTEIISVAVAQGLKIPDLDDLI